MSESRERRLLARLLLDWLEERTGKRAPCLTAHADGTFVTAIENQRLYIRIEAASTQEPPPGWQAAVASFSDRLRPGSGGVLIWLPSGAGIPLQEARSAVTLTLLQQMIDALAPGESRDARLPITIGIRKRDQAGAYVSAFGGLSPYWAQFTDRVQGYFQIDSTELHRLPDDREQIEQLVDRIVEASKGVELGETATVEADDFWRVQRLRRGEGCAIVGLPLGDESESGAPLRKRLRAAVRDTTDRLAQLADGLHILGISGHYSSLDSDPVGPALRGQDPGLFGGLDMAVLIADGGVKPLIDITRQAVLQPRAGE